MERRGFLKFAGVTSAVLAAILFSNGAVSEADRLNSDRLAEMTKNIFPNMSHFSFGPEGMTDEELKDLKIYPPAYGLLGNTFSKIQTVYTALRLYPQNIYEKFPYKFGATLCSDLQTLIDGKYESIGGKVAMAQNCPTFFINTTLALNSDVSTLSHHEIFHLLRIQTDPSSWVNIDRVFTTSPHTEKFMNSPRCSSDPKPMGYAECYGTSNSGEDQATIAEAIMTGNQDIFERAKNDTVLKDKIGAVMARYYEISDGRMNLDFFNELLHGRLDNPWQYPELL
jgi:hypothetical protein